MPPPPRRLENGKMIITFWDILHYARHLKSQGIHPLAYQITMNCLTGAAKFFMANEKGGQ